MHIQAGQMAAKKSFWSVLFQKPPYLQIAW